MGVVGSNQSSTAQQQHGTGRDAQHSTGSARTQRAQHAAPARAFVMLSLLREAISWSENTHVLVMTCAHAIAPQSKPPCNI
jgi:hypothetical protein